MWRRRDRSQLSRSNSPALSIWPNADRKSALRRSAGGGIWTCWRSCRLARWFRWRSRWRGIDGFCITASFVRSFFPANHLAKWRMHNYRPHHQPPSPPRRGGPRPDPAGCVRAAGLLFVPPRALHRRPTHLTPAANTPYFQKSSSPRSTFVLANLSILTFDKAVVAYTIPVCVHQKL